MCVLYMTTHLVAERENILPSQCEAVSNKVATLDATIVVEYPLRVSSWDAAMIPHLTWEVCHDWDTAHTMCVCVCVCVWVCVCVSVCVCVDGVISWLLG